MIQFKKDLIKSKIFFASVLSTIYGIGPHLSKRICVSCGILSQTPAYIVTSTQQNQVLNWIEKNLLDDYKIEANLRKYIKDNKLLHMKIKSYKGFRYSSHLPVRGQRTKTNAKTVKKIR
uniref:Ribosomal protein S13 n=1 Tax=Aurantiochytrium acetophilum TaxID=2172886 RepID=A0A481XLB5_9STRA|nr:ribosomal protein S13 [Aurantiochytrium acetophilum]